MANIIELKRWQSGNDDGGTLNYFIRTDVAVDNWTEILALADIPAVGARLSSDSVFIVKSRQAEQNKDDLLLWDVVVSYESTNATVDYTDQDIGRLLSLEMDSVPYEVVAEEAWDEDNDKVDNVNTAGDPFDPPMVVTVYNKLIRFTQKENALFDPSAALYTQGTLNQQSITAVGEHIPPMGGLMRVCRPALQSDGTYNTSYETEVEVDKPFIRKIASRGFRYLNAEGKLTPIMFSDINSDYASGGSKSADDAQVSDPVNLDEDGAITLGDTYYLSRRFNSRTNWNSYLNLVRRR